MSVPAGRTVVLGTTAAAVLLLLAAPTPAAALRALRDPAAATDPTAPLVALLSLLAWALAGWLALVVLVTAAGHLPGAAGRLGAAVSRRVAPAAVRRVVEVALGLSVAVGALGSSPALAAPGPAGGPAAPAAASLDWAAPAPAPGEDRGPAGPPAQDLDWAANAVAVPDAASPSEVVVQPGDSLWRLAEQDLAGRSGVTPSPAEVAQVWPSWWAANRGAVGEDPDLIHPGTPLTPPPADPPPADGAAPPDAPASS